MSKKINKDKKKRLNMPHIYFLLVMIIAVCAIATWIVPAGEFEKELNEVGKTVIVPGTYQQIESNPVGPFKMITSIYSGMIDAASIVFFVFISYASIGLIIESGAFSGLISKMLKILKGKSRVIIIPIFILLIGSASSTIGVFEEIFPFIPIFVGISIAMGYDAIVGLAIVALGAGLGYSGATINPFTVGMAQAIAGVQPLSGIGFRIFSHLVLIAVASVYVIKYALKVQADPTTSLVYGDDFSHISMQQEDVDEQNFGIREKMVLLTLLLGIVVIVYGTKVYGWYLQELSGVFLIMGIISSIFMGWSPNVIAKKFEKSFSDIAMAALMIGLARGILVVLKDGKIINTIVYSMSIPLSELPRWLAGEAMLVVQTILNFLIPSGSGQAVTSMPIMAPLSDLLDIPRQIAVLAFQFGDGLSNILWPTALTPVICGIAGVKIEKWWKWYIPLFVILLGTQFLLIALAVGIGWS